VTTVQKWLSLMAGIGALSLVLANPKGVAAAGSAVRNIVGGTEKSIITANTKARG
jgi:hypothetical protein